LVQQQLHPHFWANPPDCLFLINGLIGFWPFVLTEAAADYQTKEKDQKKILDT